MSPISDDKAPGMNGRVVEVSSIAIGSGGSANDGVVCRGLKEQVRSMLAASQWDDLLHILQQESQASLRAVFTADEHWLWWRMLRLALDETVPLDLLRIAVPLAANNMLTCYAPPPHDSFVPIMNMAENRNLHTECAYFRELYGIIVGNVTGAQLLAFEPLCYEGVKSILCWFVDELENNETLEYVVKKLLEKAPRLAFTKQSGMEPLFWACSRNNLCLEVIIELHRANPTALYTLGPESTCFHRICDHSESNQAVRCAEALLEIDRSLATLRDQHDRIPLDFAVRHSASLTKLLLQRSSMLLVAPKRRQRLVESAIWQGGGTNFECIHVLLDHDPTLVNVPLPPHELNMLHALFSRYADSLLVHHPGDEDRIARRLAYEAVVAHCVRVIMSGEDGNLPPIPLHPCVQGRFFNRLATELVSLQIGQLRALRIMASAWWNVMVRSLLPVNTFAPPANDTADDFGMNAADYGLSILLPMDRLLAGLIYGQAHFLALLAYVEQYPLSAKFWAPGIESDPDMIYDYAGFFPLFLLVLVMVERPFFRPAGLPGTAPDYLWLDRRGFGWVPVEDEALANLVGRIAQCEPLALAIGPAILLLALRGRFPLQWRQGLGRLIDVMPGIAARRDATSGLYAFQFAALEFAARAEAPPPPPAEAKELYINSLALSPVNHEGMRPNSIHELETLYGLLRACPDGLFNGEVT